jgi:hypothetical protein
VAQLSTLGDITRMAFTIHSKFARDFAAARIARWLLLPVSYLGLLIAPASVCALPFQILRSCHVTPPSVGYWISATIISGVVLFCLYRLGRRVIWEIRQRIIDMESLVGFAGFTLSAALIAYIFPQGWF